MGKTRVSRIIPPPSIAWMIAGAGVVFFLCSTVRHALFQSTAWDLGIFDQAIYLISQGRQPLSSFLGFHILGDHVSLILYPLALLYKIYPDVHWLFAVQAVALAVAAWPVWALASLAGLEQKESTIVAIAYLLYPLVFNANLFDFHPEVIALPSLLGAILAARLSHPLWFMAAVLVVLSCKEVLSLTVVAMGLWLLAFDRQSFTTSRGVGRAVLLCVVGIGVAWFIVTTQTIVPHFKGGEHGAVAQFRYLGSSVSEIAVNVFRKPGLTLDRVLSFDTAKYLGFLCLPVFWGLSWRHLTPLIAAVPTITLNVIASYERLRGLIFHYSLDVIPFLFLAVIAKESVHSRSGPWGLRYPRFVILWSLLVFLFMSQGRVFLYYLSRIDNWHATREAIAQIPSRGSVLTDNRLAVQLAHRPVIKLFRQVTPGTVLAGEYEYILVNLRHPWPDSQETATEVAHKLRDSSKFHVAFQRDDVVLFKQERANQNNGSGAPQRPKALVKPYIGVR